MTSLFAGKMPSRSGGGGKGAKPKAYPPDAALPNRQTKKIRKKKKRKTWGGERGKKNFIIIKDKRYE